MKQILYSLFSKIRIIKIILPLVLIFFTDNNLHSQILNGGFEQGANLLPDNWAKSAWLMDQVVFKWEDAGQSGAKCISIENTGLNDARWAQEISLTPGRTYLLECMVKGENISEGTGANIGFLDTWDHSLSLNGTFDWTLLQWLYTVPEGVTNLTLACRLGYTASCVSGKAWFDNIVIKDPDILSGNHIVLTVTYSLLEGYNRNDISSWVSNLDKAYEAYQELVGGVPYEGVKIGVMANLNNSPYWAWAGNPINWNSNYIRSEFENITKYQDWSFGILHEIGHNFDLDYRWAWQPEMTANLKMMYVLEKYNAKVFGGQWQGHDISLFYKSTYDDLTSKGTFAWDPATYVFSKIIDDITWEPLKQAFRSFNNMSESQLPKTAYRKFKTFMNLISSFSGRNTLSYFKPEEFDWIRKDLSPVRGISLNKDLIKLNVNTSATLTPSVIPIDAPDKSVYWQSSDSSICSVKEGLLTGLKGGSATIYAFTYEGDYVDSCLVNVIAYHSITAGVKPENSGSVSGTGLYASGDTVKLNAKANKGFKFAKWIENGKDLSILDSLSFIATENRYFTAQFKPDTFSVILSSNPPEAGKATGDGIYTYMSDVEVNAKSNKGFIFKEWSENGAIVSTDSIYKFKISFDRSLTANYTRIKYMISGTPNDAKMGSVSGSLMYDYGLKATLIATPMAGYDFVNWTENGAEISRDSLLEFKVTGNRNLIANFKIHLYKVILSATPEGAGKVFGDGDYKYCDSIRISCSPTGNYLFKKWMSDGNPVSTDSVYKFQVISDKTFVAYFEPGSGVEEFNRIGNANIYPNPASTYIHVNSENAISIEIYNFQGICVQKPELNSIINVSNLAPGIYRIVICRGFAIEEANFVIIR